MTFLIVPSAAAAPTTYQDYNSNSPPTAFDVTMLQGDGSFADAADAYDRNGDDGSGEATVLTDPTQATGAPNETNPTGIPTRSVSLGDGGSIVLRFQDNVARGNGVNGNNDAGSDIYVFETGSNTELVDVQVAAGSSSACPTTAGSYTTVGTTTKDYGGVDIDDNGFGPSSRIFCVRLVDVESDVNNTSGGYHGAEIDAVGARSTYLQGDLSVAKTASPASVNTGQDITYTITGSNLGPSSVSNATVTDTLPANTTLVSATPSQGTCTGTTTVSCSFGTLNGGATATATLVVRPTANAAGTTLSNTATIAHEAADPDTSNNTSDSDPGTAGNQPTTTSVPNRPPTAVGDAYSVNEDATLTVPASGVLDNDSDPDGNPVIVGTPRPVSGPSNGTLTLNADGSFAYTPNANFTGTDTFTYQTCDDRPTPACSSVATVTITVDPVNDPPTITTTAGATSYTENGSATVIDGGATVGDIDSANFNGGTLTVDFSAGGTATDRLGIEDGGTGNPITVVGSEVRFNGDRIGTFTGGTGTTPLVVTFDRDAATPAAAQALARSVTFANVSENPSTAQRTVRFVVTDGDGGTSNSATKAVNVTPENDGPTAADDGDPNPIAVEEDDPNGEAIDVLANDSDDGALDPGSVAVKSGPSHGTTSVDSQTGKITYTPDPNYTGPDSFTYEVCDDADPALCDEATVTVEVHDEDEPPPANRPPTATDDEGSTSESDPVTIDVLENDSDSDGDTLTVTVSKQPAHGRVDCTEAGRCTYTPDPGFAGTDSFDYKVSDGKGGTDTATVAVTVDEDPPPPPENRPPEPVDDHTTTSKGNSVKIDVLDDDSDPDGDELTVTDWTQPKHGKVTCKPDGECTYTPDEGFTGTDTFTYTVSDGQGGTREASVSIRVRARQRSEDRGGDPADDDDSPADREHDSTSGEGSTPSGESSPTSGGGATPAPDGGVTAPVEDGSAPEGSTEPSADDGGTDFLANTGLGLAFLAVLGLVLLATGTGGRLGLRRGQSPGQENDRDA